MRGSGEYESSGCENCSTPTKFFKGKLGEKTYTSLHCGGSIPNVIGFEAKMPSDDKEADMSEGNKCYNYVEFNYENSYDFESTSKMPLRCRSHFNDISTDVVS